MKYAIALDVGGTSIKSALVSLSGGIINEMQTSIVAAKTPKQVVALIESVIFEHRARGYKVVGAGIGFPGPLNSKSGVVLYTPNLPFKKPFPLRQALKERTKMPIVIQNDANLALLGEAWKGAARGARVAVMLTLGSGVGGGILIDGKIFDGAYGQGAELGHFPFYNCHSRESGNPWIPDQVGDDKVRHCGAGHPGCFEAYVNVSAIVEQGRRLFGARKVHDPRDIYELAKRGNRSAQKFFKEYGRMLAAPTAYLLKVFNPEAVIFGGAISGAWEFFAPALKKEVYRFAFRSIADQAAIKKAALGNRAGIFGAARMVFDQFLGRV